MLPNNCILFIALNKLNITTKWENIKYIIKREYTENNIEIKTQFLHLKYKKLVCNEANIQLNNMEIYYDDMAIIETYETCP